MEFAISIESPPPLGLTARLRSAVSSARGELGASSNGLDYLADYNQVASLNLNNSRSRIQDLDYAEASGNLKTKQVLEQYRMTMQKRIQESAQGILKLFG